MLKNLFRILIFLYYVVEVSFLWMRKWDPTRLVQLRKECIRSKNAFQHLKLLIHENFVILPPPLPQINKKKNEEEIRKFN